MPLVMSNTLAENKGMSVSDSINENIRHIESTMLTFATLFLPGKENQLYINLFFMVLKLTMKNVFN